MNKDMFIDIFNELETIEGEAQKLVDALQSVKENPVLLSGSVGWVTIQGIAAAIEKIYSGCERSLDIIAKRLDCDPITRDDSWHRALLQRMSSPYHDIRPTVLSNLSYNNLDMLRSFRHRVRSSYGSMLDADRVLEIATETTHIPTVLIADMHRLADALGIK